MGSKTYNRGAPWARAPDDIDALLGACRVQLAFQLPGPCLEHAVGTCGALMKTLTMFGVICITPSAASVTTSYPPPLRTWVKVLLAIAAKSVRILFSCAAERPKVP